jgi:hypothetical protein
MNQGPRRSQDTSAVISPSAAADPMALILPSAGQFASAATVDTMPANA